VNERLVFGSIKPLSAVSIWARSILIETPRERFLPAALEVIARKEGS
jgi:hypothetical protein